MAWDHLKKSSPEEVVAGVAGTRTQLTSDLSRLEIEPSDNGGFTVTHHMKVKSKRSKEGDPSYFVNTDPTKHTFESHEKMMYHVNKATK